MPCSAYQPRDAERGVLYRVVEAHLSAFLNAAADHAEGARLPMFVEQEFRDFLTCGVLTYGFGRLRCGACVFERLVPLSCKGRGFCPSCGGRRMTESAEHVIDEAEAEGDPLRFQPTPPPTDEQIGVVLAPIAARVRRVLRLLEKLAALTPRPRINRSRPTLPLTSALDRRLRLIVQHARRAASPRFVCERPLARSEPARPAAPRPVPPFVVDNPWQRPVATVA